MTDQLDVVADREATRPPPDVDVDASVGESRYPGAPPFADSEMDRLLFRGRASEIDQVLHSILSFDLFLIYAISGLGKTSLLSAGVMEPLRQRDYFPVLIRLNNPDRSPVDLIDEQLREAASKVDGITVMRNPSVRDIEGPPSTLWDLLSRLEVWKGNTLQHLVLVFDQFEELFTLGWNNDQRAQFIEQFGEVVRRHRAPPADLRADPATLLPPPAVKITLIIREDFLGELEAMAQQVPQIMRHRFRLDGLLPAQAELAIREPACINDQRLATPEFAYSEGAAHEILSFLGARQDRGRPVLTQTIDPSQLQIICQHVERSILPGKSASDGALVEISEDDLGGRTGLDRILSDFYRREIASFPSNQRKIVRNLCETGLINQRGRRLSLEEDEIDAKYKVSKATLEGLVARRLLRAEPRVGSVYYELAHDTLAAPILAYRDEARKARRRHWLEASLAIAVVALLVVVFAAVVSKGEPASAGGGTPIAVGQVVTGTIEGSGQSRLFAFEAPGNQPLIVEAKPGTGNSLDTVQLEVIEPNGRTDAATTASEGGALAIVVDATAKGRYLVVVNGTGSDNVRFELSVRPVDVTEIAIGDATTETIRTTDPVKVFSFEATDAQALTIEIKPETGTTLDAVLQMTDPGGIVSVADSGGIGDVETSLLGSTMSGRYLVVVNGFGGTVGAFGLSVRPAALVEMAIDQPETRTLSASNPAKMFAFQAAEGQLFRVEVKSDPNLDVMLQVTDPNGLVDVADSVVEGGTESLVVSRSVSGRYLILVTGQSSGGFEVTVSSAEAQEIVVGDAGVSAAIDANGAAEIFAFVATDARLLSVEVVPEATADVTLQVTGPDGYSGVAENAGEGGEESLVVSAVRSGRYQVRVIGPPSGGFELTVRPKEAPEIAIGGAPESGTIGTSNLVELFTFEATDAQALTVEVVPDNDLGLLLQVTDPNGLTNGAYNAESGIPVTLLIPGRVTGRYLVRVISDGSSGSFDVSVTPAAVVQMVIGDVKPGSVDSVIPVEAFEFDASEDETLVVEAKSQSDDGLDLSLEVTDPNGRVEFADNDFEVGAETMLIGRTVPGRYRVVVNGSGSTGEFDLTVRPVEPLEMRIGQSMSATIGAVAEYEFELSDPQPLIIEVKPSANLDTGLTVTDPNGLVFSADFARAGDAERIAFEGTASAHYLVVVSGSGSTTGKFELSLRTAQGETKEISVGDDREGTITSDSPVAVFEFKASEAQEFVVKVNTDDDLDAVLQVTDPNGQIDNIDSDFVPNTETDEIDSAARGRYLVLVSGSGTTTGDFTLSVR